MTWSILILLAFILGFVANRTTLCAVKAVSDVLFLHDTKTLISFGKIMLWAFCISTLLVWGFDTSPIHYQNHALSYGTISGGVLLGVGAVLNGGCALHTLLRLGRGDIGMLISLIGISTSPFVYDWVQSTLPVIGVKTSVGTIPSLYLFDTNSSYKLVFTAFVILWMCIESINLFRNFKISELKQRLVADCYQLSSASAILGISNGILFAIVGTWSYTHTLLKSITEFAYQPTEHSSAIPVLLWCLSLSLFSGIVISSYLKGKLSIQLKPNPMWANYFVGGLFMGTGALLIPGGNDTLLLSAIPGASPHAIPAYLSMLVGIAISLLLKMGFTNRKLRFQQS